MIAVDTKTFALHAGGISHFFAPLLQAWASSDSGDSLILAGPDFKMCDFGLDLDMHRHEIKWPYALPRSMRHPCYDNVLFPAAMRRLKPTALFTPYHDVRLPKGIPSVMIVHDLCLFDLTEAYPLKIRAYYQAMLKTNLKRVSFLLTVSETTRQLIVERYRWPEDRIAVIYNTLSSQFRGNSANDSATAVAWRQALAVDAPLLLYTSGLEYRKNIPRLLEALDLLHDLTDEAPFLLVSGRQNDRLEHVLAHASERVRSRVRFLGYLSLPELKIAYSAVDAVVFPTLGEGFGRACLESMATGTPVACSNLPVLREVAGDYPCYFDPGNTASIAEGILAALRGKRQPSVLDQRFELKSVQTKFVNLMHDVLGL